MDPQVNQGPMRGQTFSSTTLPGLLGMRRAFKNVTGLLSSDTLRDERPVWMQLVKNRKGSAILPKQLCVYKAGYFGTGVDLAAAAGGTIIHGVADPFLPAAGVADGEFFWMIINGPAKFINDANADLAEGVKLMVSPSVAGSVRLATGDTMAAIGSICGQTEAAIVASANGWGYFKSMFQD
jgi:hypothetical protein